MGVAFDAPVSGPAVLYDPVFGVIGGHTPANHQHGVIVILSRHWHVMIRIFAQYVASMEKVLIRIPTKFNLAKY